MTRLNVNISGEFTAAQADLLKTQIITFANSKGLTGDITISEGI